LFLSKNLVGQTETEKFAGQTVVTRSEQALSSTFQGEPALSPIDCRMSRQITGGRMLVF